MEPSTKLRSAGRPEAEGNRRTDQRANGSQHLGGIRRSDQNAAIAGDVAMIESEVQPVLKTLRSRDINVVAIHNHMIGVSPHVVFLHYWARVRRTNQPPRSELCLTNSAMLRRAAHNDWYHQRSRTVPRIRKSAE